MAFLHLAATVTVNGIQRRALGGSVSIGFRSNFATARVSFDSTEDGADPGDTVLVSLGYQETGQLPVFGGEADDDTRDYWPLQPGVSASGYLARLQRGIGKSMAGAPADEDTGEVPAYYAEGVRDDEIVQEVLDTWGIQWGALDGDTPAVTFGQIEPVTIGKNEPAWNLISDLDRLTFMRTFDGPDGLVYRTAVNMKPSTAALTLRQGVHLVPGTSRGRSRRAVINWVDLTGLADAGGPGVTPFAERFADPPIVNGKPLIPDPPKYQSEQWQTDLAETEEVCDRYAARRIDQMNRLAETIQVRIDRLRPDIRPGMSIAIDSPALGYDASYTMWVEQVEHTWDATSGRTTLGLIVASAEGGTNPNQPPRPVITYIIEQEYIDGQKVWIVRADGSGSYDPDGEATDLDPQHGVTTYLWSGTPVGPSTPAGLPQATFVYTSDPTGAQICLTVGDIHLKLATACVTITAQRVRDALVRDLWAAVTSDLLYSHDGGGVWASTGVAAAGCCEIADPEYQLAWTSGGDLWRVTVTAAGAFAGAAVLTGHGITAAGITVLPNGSSSHRCWAVGTGGAVWFSSLDGGAGTWRQVGTIPAQAGSSNVANAIQESPYAAGDLTALRGNSALHSFDGGVGWTVLKSYPDAALTATRLASGRFADLTQDKSYRWVSFAGTSGNTASRILETANQEGVDWPAGAKPAQPTGLTIGLDGPSLTLVDIAGSGRSWRIANFTGGGELVQKTWDASFGLPRHIIRDGALDLLIYGAADSAIFKSYDGFETVVELLHLTSPRAGRMVGYGRLAHAPAIEGDIYASAFLNPGPANGTEGRGTTKIIKLAGTTWSAVADHPIPASVNASLRGGQAPTPGLVTLASWTGFNEAFCNYVRPLVRGANGALYTWAFVAYAEDVICVTPGLANLYKSTDLGATWTALGTITGVLALDVAVDGTLWAVASDGSTVLRSADGGATWTQALRSPHDEFPIVSPYASTGTLGWLNRWTGISCGPSSARDIAVSDAYYGFARTGNGVNFGFAKAGAIGFKGGNYGICRTPGGAATLVEKRLATGHTTFRLPDGVSDAATGDYSVMGDSSSPANGGGLGGPNAYRRAGARVYWLGRNVYDGFTGFGTTVVSADDGLTWTPALTTADVAAFGLANGPSYDAGYDATTETVYLGLANPHNGGVSVMFLKKAGAGAWQDITGTMNADMGGLYSPHTLGIVAGVR